MKNMAKSEKEASIELIRRFHQDPELYYKHCLKIQNFGTGELVPFTLNPVQKILHDVAQRQLRQDQQVRLIVLKARRFGISTYVQARFFQKASMSRNKNVTICTHSKPATDTMFSMARLMEMNLPDFMKPETKYSGKRELVWGGSREGLNSSYALSTVGGSEVRGSKVDFLHCSETAFWGDGGADYLLGLMNTVVQGYGTEIFLESTANGTGGIFYDLWWQAVNKESGFEGIFFPWYIYEPYSKPFNSKKEKKEFEKSLGTDPLYGGEEEEGLLGLKTTYELDDGDLEFECTLENLNWRRNCIKTNCQSDVFRFHQEYPTTAREAFVTTGRMVFDQSILQEMVYESEKRQKERPCDTFNIPVNITAGRDYIKQYRLESEDGGDLAIWSPPRKNRSYKMGVDVSEGLEISNRDTDWSVAVVLDMDTYEECAMLRTKIDPDLLAWQLAALGKYYNNCQIVCERNNHGLVSLKFLQEIHNYEDIYFEKILDERSNRSARKIGFHTSIKSKPVIIDHLRELVREREICLHSPKLIDEMQTFVFHSNGKMSANQGSHDDCVMALAIACFGIKINPVSELPPPIYSASRPPVRYYSPPRI